MTVQTALAIALVVGFGAAQYILAFEALRDLARRPRVRGGNKITWALLILCLPIAGALIYGWMGPTSLLRKPHTPVSPPVRPSPPNTSQTAARRNVTPISAARKRTRENTDRDSRRAPRRFTRTGS